jgi:hypothetical protein
MRDGEEERRRPEEGLGGREICGWRVGVGDFILSRARGDRLAWWSRRPKEQEAGGRPERRRVAA